MSGWGAAGGVTFLIRDQGGGDLGGWWCHDPEMHPMGEFAGSRQGDRPLVAAATRRLRVVAAVSAALSAALVLFGSFLPLYGMELPMAEDGGAVAVTSWGVEETPGDELMGYVPTSGYALSAAAALMLAAALSCALSATPAAPRGTPRVSGLIAVGGFAFLAGTVSVIGTHLEALAEGLRRIMTMLFGTEGVPDHGVRPGLWVLVAAVVFALVTVVQMLRSTGARHQDDAMVGADLDTPPFGVPVVLPVGYDPPESSQAGQS
jgi:hypothetical protein